MVDGYGALRVTIVVPPLVFANTLTHHVPVVSTSLLTVKQTMYNPLFGKV